MTASIECRLCGGQAQDAFRATVLGKHQISFFRCTGCSSLETEVPYWLPEAYSKGEARSTFDTGSVARTRRICASLFVLYRLGGFQGSLLDFGGGTGLLCRMLRDGGIDAYSFDEYADGGYAKGFQAGIEDRKYDVIAAIEVFEHLPNPRETLDKIFNTRVKLVFATTVCYSGQGADWNYLSLFTGQHVFFYSRSAIEWIARRHGYEVAILGDLIIFIRSDLSSFQKFRLRRLRREIITATECLMPLLSRRGAESDYTKLVEKFPDGVV